MPGDRWVHLPKSDARRALIARLGVALDDVERPDGGMDVDVRFHGETMNRTEHSNLLVLGPDSADAMIEAVEHGAAGYLPTSRATETLIAAIVDVSLNRAVVPDEMLGTLLREVVRARRVAPADDPRLDSLTPREREVFELAAHGLDKFGIGLELDISPATARTHLANIMSKMDVRSRAELVALAASIGIDTTPRGE